MAYNTTNPYDVDLRIAELYDRSETGLEDVELIRRLVGNQGPWNILEPFTGTGRILIPLLTDGHAVTGIDQSFHMLERARAKIEQQPAARRALARLIHADVLNTAWPDGFDLVILGGNCFYELATPEEQESCVQKAAQSLKPGGYVFIDNDHMEGSLDVSWQNDAPQQRGIAGTCQDGATVESWMQTVWFDAPKRLARFRRWIKVTLADGSLQTKEYVQQKHPVSTGEVQSWLVRYGFVIEALYGDRQASQYTDSSRRAIFWARKAA